MDNYFGAPAHLKKSFAPAQARCDAIQAEYRADPKPRPSIRRDTPPLPPALVPTDDALKLRLALHATHGR